MKKYIPLFFIMLLFCGSLKSQIKKVAAYKEPSGLVLENNQLKAIFDAQNGALLSFTSKATGWQIGQFLRSVACLKPCGQ